MVGDHAIPGGSIYLGQHLPRVSGAIEPSLINPDLPVAISAGQIVVPAGGQGLAYHLLSPAARKAYLDWQAGGRRTDVTPSLVLLFCAGIERRILVDVEDDPAVTRELPALTAEVRRLRARYGEATAALRTALEQLLDLLELLTAPRSVPTAGPDRDTPTAVRIGLARFAISSTPMPVAWVRAWIRHHPSLAPRRSESDCPAEFGRLFTLRYRDRHGRGIVVPGDGTGVRLRYRPGNPGLAATLVWRADLPDLLSDPRRIRAVAALRDEVATSLNPYRRWLARFPQGRWSLAAVPLLPAELVDGRHGQLGAVRIWAERRLDGRPRATIDAGEFWDFWLAAAPERMTTDEAATLLGVLARLGLGVEPDVRFGAPPLAPGPAILFRLGGPTADRPGPRFACAAAIVRCAAAAALAAGPLDPAGPTGTTLLTTVADLAAALCLEPGEDVRLAARLGWLLTTRVDLDRLGRQTTTMTSAEREIAGHYLVTVALTADPVIGPATITVLTRLYRILGLQVDLVFQRVHDRSTGGAPVLPPFAGASAGAGTGTARIPGRRPDPDPGAEWPDEPVVVQTGGGEPGGYPLPWAAFPGVRLDRSLIQKKVAESGTAAALLGAVFADAAAADHDPRPSAEQPPTERPSAEQPPYAVAGLDRAHGALLHALGERETWTREEFDSLAAAHGVLPDGALDLLNEVAIDATGVPLVEGDSTLTLADDVLLELLR